MNVANPVILKIGKTNPMLLQVCQPVRGVNKEKLIFINKNGEEQYVYDGSKEVKVPLSSGGGGIEEPIEGERYLVYRVGETRFYSPHYTIRKYHNGSFGSKDVKYWIRLKDLIEHEF